MIKRVRLDSSEIKQQLREQHQEQEPLQPLQPQQPQDTTNTQDMCGICMCSMTTPDCVPMVGTCGHSYCEACIVCRAKITAHSFHSHGQGDFSLPPRPVYCRHILSDTM